MINGFDKLIESDQKLFNSFCDNYRAANSFDIEIVFISVKRETNYLRVDLTKNGRKTYQEVFDSTTWG